MENCNTSVIQFMKNENIKTATSSMQNAISDYTGHGIGNADGIENQANAKCRRHWEDGIRRH